MTQAEFTVFVVDDDAGVLNALASVIRASGYEVRAFSSPELFLAEHDLSVPGCAIFDVSMPGLDGLQLQEALAADGAQRPVIFVTGVGDIPMSVRAMKAGAVDFLTKPVGREQLLSAIVKAAGNDAEARRLRQEATSIRARLESLTAREYEVLALLVAGKVNKQIAHELGITVKTVKVHRANAMRKLAARSMVDLVLLAEKAGIRIMRPVPGSSG
jgi:FixJ family two-component response regulator